MPTKTKEPRRNEQPIKPPPGTFVLLAVHIAYLLQCSVRQARTLFVDGTLENVSFDSRPRARLSDVIRLSEGKKARR